MHLHLGVHTRWDGNIHSLQKRNVWGGVVFVLMELSQMFLFQLYVCQDHHRFYFFLNNRQGFNRRNKTECEKCGGTYHPWYTWGPGKWESKRQVWDGKQSPPRLIYKKPKYGTKPVWSRIPSQALWLRLIDAAKAVRLGTIFTNSLLCKSGVTKQLLNLISCGCGGVANDTCQNTLLSSVYPVGLVSLCVGIPTIITIYGGATLDPKNLIIESNISCVMVHSSIVPYNQFTYNEKRRVSSLAIYSETSYSAYKSFYVHNDYGTVVGQLMSDGMSLSYDPSVRLNGTKFCLPLPPKRNISWGLRSALTSYDLVLTYYPFTSFTLQNLNVSTNATSICTNLYGKNETYFIVGFVQSISFKVLPKLVKKNLICQNYGRGR
eukprot:TRINITY_DN6947_c0_g1_i3.p1 TRINITY_DN6947_c0_g1~~TRINITY_DN6947_c0_g1_i3.p1  ORF type:complete len:377 (+),score=39.69 TRINITY_DN6947_c0_g1_i3:45-1175(+)